MASSWSDRACLLRSVPKLVDSRLMRHAGTFLRTLALIVGIILPTVVAADEFQEKELTDANYAKWRDHVLPKNWELSYRKIPWRTSFWDAVIEAQARNKPILLWAMNGHPLCNT